MNSNLLTGIYNIVCAGNTLVNELREEDAPYNIRINNLGVKLEEFIKDAIANTFDKSRSEADETYPKVYSWLGSQNNPPDLIIENGDAFEIKKIEKSGITGNLALNSSHPKDKLYADDPKITRACRECEGKPWDEKDIFYTMGAVSKNNTLKTLFFVQGLCYIADREVYEKLQNSIKEKTDEGISLCGYTSSETKELGRINRVDPLGITNLRIRGMWEIKNPFAVFERYLEPGDFEFCLYAILTKDKYNSYPKESRMLIENDKRIKIKDIELVDPNNLAKRLSAKLIKSCR